MNKQYPMRQQAEQLAAQGRYGDTRLLHVNELELQGLASLMPNGELTINPETGQPEAFAFLIPMLASGIGAAAGWGTLGTAALSGAMTAAATGDLKRGLASAVMGAGLGSALGAAGDAGAEAAAEAAAQAAAEGVAEGTIDTAAQTALAEAGAEQAAEGALAEALGQNIPADQLAMSSPAAPTELAQALDPEVLAAQQQAIAAQQPQTWYGKAGQNLKNTFTGEGGEQVLPELTKSSNFLPIALGGGQLEQMEQEEDWAKQAKKLTEERDAEGRAALERAYGNLQMGYAAAGHQPGLSPYRRYMSSYMPPPRGYAGGGTIKYNGQKMDIDEFWERYGGMYGYGPDTGYSGIDPVTVQKNLRHTPVAAPPNYMHGFNPEFSHFQNLSPDAEGNTPEPYIPAYTSPEQSSLGMYSGGINRFMGADAPQQLPTQPVPASPPPANQTTEPYPVDVTAPGDGDAATHPSKKWRGGGGGGGRGKGRNMKLHAAGGDIQLDTGAGPMTIAGGGIAEIPNAFDAAQAAGGRGVEPSTEDVQAVSMALLRGGQGADQIINQFISRYGVETFRMVRQMVLEMAAGQKAQTEGMVKGPGGGMDDKVTGTIGNQQGIAVSPGEYIVPADVVSGLGDGSSDAGATELDRMSDRVRMARGGNTQQPPPFDARRVMPK